MPTVSVAKAVPPDPTTGNLDAGSRPEPAPIARRSTRDIVDRVVDITKTLQLVKRAQKGDEAALNRLFERYFYRVRRVVRARMGERLRRWHDSVDIVQETFLTALRNFEKFEMRNEAAFINYLSKIAENQIRGVADYSEAEKRNSKRDVSLDVMRSGDNAETNAQFDPASECATPSEAVAVEEEQALLDRIVNMLPEKQRELVLLRDYTGHSWAQIAEQTGRPSPDAARVAHNVAKAELVLLLNRERRNDVGRDGE